MTGSPHNSELTPKAALEQLHGRLKLVILDFEGVIVDSEFPKRQAFVHVAKELFGATDLSIRDFTWTLGLKKPEIIKRLSEQFEHRQLQAGILRDTSISLGEQFLNRRDELVPRKNMQTMAGAIELLEMLQHHKIPTAIGSSTYQEVGQEMLAAAQVPADFFDAMVWGDHPWVKEQRDPTKRSIFQRAARELLAPADINSINSKRILVVGDARADTQGAQELGFSSLLLPDRRIWGDTPDDEAVRQATFLAQDLFEAKQLLKGLVT